MRLRLLPLLLILALATFATPTPNARAANIPVSNLSDSGAGSLRQAIMDANGNPGPDTITFTVTGTINITSAQLPTVTEQLTITGPGQSLLTINVSGCAGCNGLVFNAAGSVSGLTVSGSPGIGISGAAFSIDSVTVTGSAIAGLSSAASRTVLGSVSVRNSTITANPGDGIVATAIALGATGSVSVENSKVTSNTGRGIFGSAGGNASSAHIGVTASEVFDNHAGGISITGEASLGLTNSTISGNSSASGSGGVQIVGGSILMPPGGVTISNSSIIANSGAPGFGGGIASTTSPGSPTPAAVTLTHTLVANNTSTNCSGTMTSQGHNLSSDASCSFAGPGDLNSTNPLVGPLANNGGTTQTHALLPASPAIDAGDNNTCVQSFDQRGVSRPRDGDSNGSSICDIGAYEAGPNPALQPPTLSKAFASPTVVQNQTVGLTFTLTNPNASPLTHAAFTDTLPSGLVIATPNGLADTCGFAGAVSAPAGGSSIQLTNGNLNANANCTVQVSIQGVTLGQQDNVTSTIQSAETLPGSLATASVTVVQSTNSTTIQVALVPASPVAAGSFVHSTATLSGATGNAGGTVTYSVYTNNTCTAAYVGHQPPGNPVTVTNGVVPASGNVTFDQAGTFYWQAAYSGDANNGPGVSACVALVSNPNNTVTFQQVPGAARDIAIGADGTVFVIGLSPVGNTGDYGIYKLTNGLFQAFPGAAVRVAVDPAGNPWVINAAGSIYRWNGSAFIQVPGGALDIAVGADGSVWVIGVNSSIYKLTSGIFSQVPGAGTRISVGADGNPWVINSASSIYHLTNGLFSQVPGAARDIDSGPNAQVWVIGTQAVGPPGNFGIYQLTSGTFQAATGAAAHIAVGGPNGTPWVINAAANIYQSVFGAPLRAAPATAPTLPRPTTPATPPTPVPPRPQS